MRRFNCIAAPADCLIVSKASLKRWYIEWREGGISLGAIALDQAGIIELALYLLKEAQDAEADR